MRKKRVLFHSDFALTNSGFGRNAKAVLSYLYSLDKYELLNLSCGYGEKHSQLSQTPWKSVGTLTSNEKRLEHLQSNPDLFRVASYGSEKIDEVVKDFKPDVYIGAQDIWGLDYSVPKPWFSKVSSAIWTTLDSLPILPSAVKLAPSIKNYWIWSEFATEALHEMGHTHVKTVHGAIETRDFYRLPDESKLKLRALNNISSDNFIIGFVFRNQLRKSVPNLLEGFKKFKDSLGEQGKLVKLLLHTNFSEGWNILRLATEYGIDHQDILTTLICSNCGAYSVQNFVNQDQSQCKVCGHSGSMTTTNIEIGVKESQLNEIYNLMDVYCHPFTSGGQEIPIQEAKLTELITLVTGYSCGETMCKPEAHSIPLEYSEYREHNTEFRKASTCPNSIADALGKVYHLDASERRNIGQKAREWVLDNFSKEAVGKQIEEFIDSSDYITDSVFSEGENKNPEAEIDYDLSDSEWLKSLYVNVLDMEPDEDNLLFKEWLSKLTVDNPPVPREDVENYFRGLARKDLSSKIDYYLSDEDKGKRILFVMPSVAKDIFLITSLFESALETYPDHNIYVAVDPNYASILDGNPHVHKILPLIDNINDIHWLEGNGEHEGFFNIAYLLHAYNQVGDLYTHQGRDKLIFNTKK